jgi:hypothetical protein
MSLRNKHTGQRSFTYTPNENTQTSFPQFLTRISSASTKTVTDIANTPVTIRKPNRRSYSPMSINDLLEYFWMTDGIVPRYEGTLHLDTCKDLDFCEQSYHAYA